VDVPYSFRQLTRGQGDYAARLAVLWQTCPPRRGRPFTPHKALKRCLWSYRRRLGELHRLRWDRLARVTHLSYARRPLVVWKGVGRKPRGSRACWHAFFTS
jgi:hypothetical protein